MLPIERRCLLFTLMLMTACILPGCGQEPAHKKLGVVNYYAALEPALDGLRAGLSEQGYEGQIVIEYSGSVGHNLQKVEEETRRLLSMNIDLLFTMGTIPALVAKSVLADQPQKTPIVFTPLIDPVGEGLVLSLATPGTGITGVHNANLISKAMEWLLLIMPDTSHLIIFYHPEDHVSERLVQAFEELILPEQVRIDTVTVEDIDQALNFLDAASPSTTLLVIPSPRLGDQQVIMETALDRGVPVFGYNTPVDHTIASYTVDWFEQGRQTSFLVSRILEGADPAKVSVEAADSHLLINLANARRSQFEIEYRWLSLAHRIVR